MSRLVERVAPLDPAWSRGYRSALDVLDGRAWPTRDVDQLAASRDTVDVDHVERRAHDYFPTDPS